MTETMVLTALQENAAKLFVQGRTKSDAYREAGYSTENMLNTTINEEASRLFGHPHISARVAQLQAEAAIRHNVTVDTITEELEEARTLAATEIMPAAMVSASMGKAKLHGLLKDQVEVSGQLALLSETLAMIDGQTAGLPKKRD